MNINKTLVLTGIDFTSQDFRFISRDESGDEYWVPGNEVNCSSDCSIWTENDFDDLSKCKISDGWGFFKGLTNVSYRGYSGNLPRLDEDSSSFDEFDIYYKEWKIDHLTIEELINIIKSESRNTKIDNIIK
jgi:hypothetical protein